MNKQTNKENSSFWDYMIPGGLLFLSYMLMYYLPQEMDLKAWVLFGISVFLFCIGYFRLLQALPESKTTTEAIARKLIILIIAISVFFAGLYYIYVDNGSEKSIVIATVFLIEGLAMSSFGDDGNERSLLSNDIMKRVYLALIAALAIAGVWFCYQDIIAETASGKGRVETATMLWIAAGVLWYTR